MRVARPYSPATGNQCATKMCMLMNVPNTKPLSPGCITSLNFHFFVIEPLHTSVDTSVGADWLD